MKNIIILASMFLFFGKIDSAQAYYKIQDRPGELTKKVNLWGYVNNPGRYEVPASTNLIQLVTYAGGPKEYASMSDIRIFRVTND
ncbi:MAG TPA: SLBB domain-containing protein, partial [Ignavibacteriales bacterium]|nr:SLBB domain-containing protein [Ignavibacteriales bacterium]